MQIQVAGLLLGIRLLVYCPAWDRLSRIRRHYWIKMARLWVTNKRKNVTAGLKYRHGNRPLTHDDTRGGKEREEEVEKSRKRRHSDTESSVISGSTFGSSSADTERESLSSSTPSSTSIGQKKIAKKGKKRKKVKAKLDKKKERRKDKISKKAQLRDKKTRKRTQAVPR